ncbi:hypothetical protein, partial [Shewanella xiamenensis]|uniref:hypothetical protein n=1 Tax=Shewanella xiamenensis TaxID=332186 RepID=UPI001C6305D3
LMSFSDYIVAHCEADLKWMGPFHYPRTDSLRVGERMPWRTYQLVPTFLTTYDPCIIYAGVINSGDSHIFLCYSAPSTRL